MIRLAARRLLTAAVLAGCTVMLGACGSAGSKTPRTAQPAATPATTPAATPAATPANAITAAPASRTASRKETPAVPPPAAAIAAAPRTPSTNTAALPPISNPSDNACAPAPQPVESSTGSNNVRVKDCKRNQFVLLPASLQSLIDGYVAECSAKCAPK